ncbi:MAG TPA: hypothetical protein VNJ46_03175 [Gaiellaceae bacterium]|nr:hypothetical protein [Gaiellaceae bacterium]
MASSPPRIAPDEAPLVDPEAVRRSYRFYRAQRLARERRDRERRFAAVRFWTGLLLVLAAALLLAARTLGELERVFGL